MIRPSTHNDELIHLARSELSTFTGSQHHATSYVATVFTFGGETANQLLTDIIYI